MNILHHIRQSIEDHVSEFFSGEELTYGNGQSTDAGVYVKPEGALSINGVWACITLLADIIAMLPLDIYKLSENGKEKDYENPYYRLFKYSPNPMMSAYVFIRTIVMQMQTYGAGIAVIDRNSSGEVINLWVVPTKYVTVVVDKKYQRCVYLVKIGEEKEIKLSQDDVLVFTTPYSDPFKFRSPIEVHRETLGFDIALRSFGAKTFGTGTNPSAVLTTPSIIQDKDLAKKVKEYAKEYSGLGKSHRLMLLQGGMKLEKVSLPPEDAQYLETKQFSLADIARIYRVPLNLIQSHEKSTSFGTGMEEINSNFLTYTIQPIATQFEQELNNKILGASKGQFYKFGFGALLKTKLSERNRAYAQGRQWGWYSVNDIRLLEDHNTIENGDVYLQPMNMVDATKADSLLNDGKKKDFDNEKNV